ncbi:uncharacterized protein LOC100822691 [Brachypodium distachyon]|nr:uncharacterized protein LOC100822691 [Brachypodium distachyon]XP_014753378.1 uncharacterized protein LOC100822691 [Brachypodium distachyon]|eukprot:XP_010235809.1 uncharacterized protein LOC100822691 [Brachypodium distachyon]
MPCRDKREWQKMGGCHVEPPVYTKVVGRPSLKRKKNPLEEEEDRRMSRHGAVSHCSVFHSVQHNKRRCPKLGRGPVQEEATAAEEEPTPAEPEVEPIPARATRHRKLPVRRNVIIHEEPLTQESGVSSVGHNVGGSQQSTQRSMLYALMEEAATTQVSQGPLPESSFIARNRDALPTARATTATVNLVAGAKKRRATVKKSKAAAAKAKAPEGKGKAGAAKAKAPEGKGKATTGKKK